MSRFASHSFRQFLAVLLFGCVVGGGTALGLVAGHSSGVVWIPLMVFFCASVFTLSVCVDSLERGLRDDEDEDDDDFRRGWDDPPVRPHGPGGEPAWWPQFEADLRAYVSDSPSGKDRLAASMLDRRR